MRSSSRERWKNALGVDDQALDRLLGELLADNALLLRYQMELSSIIEDGKEPKLNPEHIIYGRIAQLAALAAVKASQFSIWFRAEPGKLPTRRTIEKLAKKFNMTEAAVKTGFYERQRNAQTTLKHQKEIDRFLRQKRQKA